MIFLYSSSQDTAHFINKIDFKGQKSVFKSIFLHINLQQKLYFLPSTPYNFI